MMVEYCSEKKGGANLLSLLLLLLLFSVNISPETTVNEAAFDLRASNGHREKIQINTKRLKLGENIHLSWYIDDVCRK